MDRHEEVLKYLRQVQQASLHEIYLKVSFSYYCSWDSRMRVILNDLIEDGDVIQAQTDVYKINEAPKPIKKEQQSNIAEQGSLF